MRRRIIKKRAKIEWRKQLETMEIGNLLWGHSRGRYPVDRDKFQYRFVELLKQIGYDNHGVELEEGEEGYTGKINSNFIVRPYCWDDDSPDCLLPNFECPKLKFTLSWYKYALRDSYSNKELTEELMQKLEELAI